MSLHPSTPADLLRSWGGHTGTSRARRAEQGGGGSPGPAEPPASLPVRAAGPEGKQPELPAPVFSPLTGREWRWRCFLLQRGRSVRKYEACGQGPAQAPLGKEKTPAGRVSTGQSGGHQKRHLALSPAVSPRTSPFTFLLKLPLSPLTAPAHGEPRR